MVAITCSFKGTARGEAGSDAPASVEVNDGLTTLTAVFTSTFFFWVSAFSLSRTAAATARSVGGGGVLERDLSLFAAFLELERRFCLGAGLGAFLLPPLVLV